MATPRAQKIALVCLDIAGTLTEGSTGPPLPGAVAAGAAWRMSSPSASSRT
jgi:hypothetical protein